MIDEVTIPLNKGQYAIVDTIDVPLIEKHKWFVCPSSRTTFYVITTNGKGKTTYMHRLLTNAPKGMEVHHINRNGLDNRRKNLQILTPIEHGEQHRGSRTHCRYGHLFDEENTGIKKSGYRFCRICAKIQQQQQYQRRPRRQSQYPSILGLRLSPELLFQFTEFCEVHNISRSKLLRDYIINILNT
jgi:hypothetical protein